MSRSPDGSKTEKSELSFAPTADNYGSTSMKDKSDTRFYVPFCGLVFYIMDFLGYFCSGLLREGLNVAIVAMVNQTTVTEVQTTNISGQCPKEPEIIGKRAGEFNWDRSQEGILLAAFYYGYIVTQVISIKNLLYLFISTYNKLLSSSTLYTWLCTIRLSVKALAFSGGFNRPHFLITHTYA